MSDSFLDVERFIARIYARLFGRDPDEGGAAGLRGALKDAESAAAILTGFATSPEAVNRRTGTAALVAFYQDVAESADAETRAALRDVLRAFSGMQHVGTHGLARAAGASAAYDGHLRFDRDDGSIAGWLLVEEAGPEHVLTVRVGNETVFAGPVATVDGTILIDIPLSSPPEPSHSLTFDPRTGTIVIRTRNILKEQLFAPDFYHTQAEGDIPDPLEHYIASGFAAGLRPNPFAVPGLLNLRHSSVDAILDIARIEPNSVLEGLIDCEYCAARNKVAPEKAIAFATEAVMAGRWVDFHPLLTEEDFRRSGQPDLIAWLGHLTDPDRSLAGMRFVRFMPGYYRATCSDRQIENELLDYLFNAAGETGEPHVFCNTWYATQHLPGDFDWPRRGIWSDSFVAPDRYRIPFSPFWEPLAFQHRAVHERGFALREGRPALDMFMSQTADVLAPSQAIVPSALVHAFLGRDLAACDPRRLGADDVVAALEAALLHRTEPAAAPALSVCILNYNKPGFSVLAAIAAATSTAQPVEVLVLDNGSGPMDFAVIGQYLEALSNARVIRSRANLYFGEGNNVLADMARADRVLFLNNDAFVGPATIDAMMDHLDADPGAAAVGPTFLFPDLEVQEAGGTVSDCGRQVQLHKHTPLDGHLRFMPETPVRGVQYVSAACLCVRRSVLDDIGGFDHVFEPFYFEDTDLCKRMASAGYRLDYLPRAFVIHYENASTREFLSDGMLAQIEKNRARFQKRWLYRAPDYRPRTMPRHLSGDFDPARPTVAVYTPFDVSLGGGERFILSCAVALGARYNVLFCSDRPVSRTRIAFMLDDLGIPADAAGAIRPVLFEDVTDWSGIEALIAMGNEIVPPVPMQARVNIFHCQYPFPAHHSDRFETERLRNVDEYLVNSDYTRRRVLREAARLGFDIPVFVSGAPVRRPAADPAPRDAGGGLHLLNIGRFETLGHAKRQDIVVEIFRRFHAQAPESTLSLAGSGGGIPRREAYIADLRRMAQGLPVAFHIDASRPVLEEELARADIYLHACGYAISPRGAPERQEHFGIAVLEAMAAGAIPVVYAAGGPAEIVAEADAGFTFGTVSEAEDILRRIRLMPPGERAAIAARGRAAAARYFDEAFQAAILDRVERRIGTKALSR